MAGKNYTRAKSLRKHANSKKTDADYRNMADISVAMAASSHVRKQGAKAGSPRDIAAKNAGAMFPKKTARVLATHTKKRTITSPKIKAAMSAKKK
jgi:hypothetical protein